MTISLDVVISDLKRLSGGKTIKVQPPDDALLDEYELETGFKFDDDYRRFLKEASTIFYGTKDPLLVTRSAKCRGELKEAIREARKVGLPIDWLPICEDNGSYYCITPDHKVRYWAGDGETDESWPDLATWIKSVWLEGG